VDHGVKSFDLICLGRAAVDLYGEQLGAPLEDMQTFKKAVGGCAGNIAVGCARLGASTAFVGRVGHDVRGEAIIEALVKENVDTRFTARDRSSDTGVALVMVDTKGHKQILTAPLSNLKMTVRDVLDASELIANARVVLLQLEIPQEAVEVAVRLSRAAGARVVLDPAPARELPEEVLREVHVIRPNPVEAQGLTSIKVTDRRSARLAAENLLRRGVGAAVVRARDGSLLVTSEGACWFPEHKVKAVDKTGAGDAFCAALAVCVSRGEMLPDAVRFASAAAAFKVTRLGAQAGMPRRRDVERLLRSVEPAPLPDAR